MSSFDFSFITEDVQSYGVMVVALIAIIIFIIKVIRERNQSNKECRKMNSLYPSINNNIRPIISADPNCKHKLHQYLIKTAYNACSSGKFKNDYVDVCNLIALIREGVRCLDFEVYSVGNKPVVATSTKDNYHIKETYDSVDFSTIMSTINNYAFASGTCPNHTDPLIIHLRFKTSNQEIYTKMAQIFQTYSHRMVDSKYYDDGVKNELFDMPLLSLRNKIIIIVDKSNDAFMENNTFLEFVNMASNTLSMRAYEYKTLQSADMDELATYNATNATIVLPNKGNTQNNPDSQIALDSGCQFVAMMFQHKDEALGEYNLFFNKAGYAFALKQKQTT
jgi:hypothetical protein